ncbi:MAG TPA: oxidoreductase, partial [Rhodobacteraceae bacterium]|nr:oxidoreductase [Paracoccaceae bacterium]
MKSIIVQDTGFVLDDWSGPLLDWDIATQGGADPENGYGLDVPNTVTAKQL